MKCLTTSAVTWLANRTHFTYKELYAFLIGQGIADNAAKKEIRRLAETSCIRRYGKYYTFTSVLFDI